MHIRHHAAGTPAANALEDGQWRLHKLRKFLNCIALLRSQRETRCCGNRQNAAGAFGLYLKNVSGKLLDLLPVYGNDLPSGSSETVEHAFAFRSIVDGFTAEDGKAVTDAHHHVRVENRIAIFVLRMKGDRLVLQGGAKLVQYIGIGARRKVGVRKAVGMIEHHTSGSLQKTAFILVIREVDDARNPEPSGLKFLDDIATPLGPAAGRKHRIQHDRAVVMERNPVIREDRIWCLEFLLILEDDHFRTGIAQAPGQQIELDAGAALDFFSVGVGNLPLKQKRWSSIGVEAK